MPYSKLNASTMGGQRKGSLKDRSELEFSYRRKKLLNLALFDTQLGSKNKVERNDAEVDFCLRYFLLKKDHERRVNEIESRIEQSTCIGIIIPALVYLVDILFERRE